MRLKQSTGKSTSTKSEWLKKYAAKSDIPPATYRSRGFLPCGVGEDQALRAHLGIGNKGVFVALRDLLGVPAAELDIVLVGALKIHLGKSAPGIDMGAHPAHDHPARGCQQQRRRGGQGCDQCPGQALLCYFFHGDDLLVLRVQQGVQDAPVRRVGERDLIHGLPICFDHMSASNLLRSCLRALPKRVVTAV